MYDIQTTPNRKTFNQMSAKDLKAKQKENSQNVHFFLKSARLYLKYTKRSLQIYIARKISAVRALSRRCKIKTCNSIKVGFKLGSFGFNFNLDRFKVFKPTQSNPFLGPEAPNRPKIGHTSLI